MNGNSDQEEWLEASAFNYSDATIESLSSKENQVRMRNNFNNRPPCKDYEKLWNNRCIDRGLEERWLENLNSLHYFDLISICEGHEKRRGVDDKKPHINLRYKHNRRVNLPANSMNELSIRFHQILFELFPSVFFDVKLFLEFVLSNEHDDIGINDLMVSVYWSTNNTEHKDVSKEEWFETAVKRLIELDRQWGESLERIFYKSE